MNRICMIALLSLLVTGRVAVGDLVDTNRMPLPVHDLMKTTGHALVVQTNRVLVPPDPDSLRNLPPVEFKRLTILKPAPPKSFWSFWDNSRVKYIHLNHDPMNYLAPQHLTPYTALNQLEYDIVYSFDF